MDRHGNCVWRAVVCGRLQGERTAPDTNIHVLVDNKRNVAESYVLLLWLFAGDSMTPFGPSCLYRSPHDATAFFRVDVAPASRTKPNRLAADGRRREFSACQVEDLEREVHEDLRRQAGLAHQSAKKRRASRTEDLGPFAREFGGLYGLSFHA